jgi:imidazolonepropionase-like amidohydrolase
MNTIAMMKTKYAVYTLALLMCSAMLSDAQNQPLVFANAIIHVGNGTVITNGSLVIHEGKILQCAQQTPPAYAGATTIDLAGKHVYPGLICLSNIMGLNEIEAVRATLDFRETGEINPNVRSVIAFNTDSKIIPTALSNGILYTQAVPQGGLISGTSSIMRTTGWNWEDAVLKEDDAIHLNWPEELGYSGWWAEGSNPVQQKRDRELHKLKTFLEEAWQYANQTKQELFNARFQAMKCVFEGTQPLFIHAQSAQAITEAVQYMHKFPAVKPVIVDATEAWQVSTLLAERKIPVVFTNVHQLPRHPHSDIDQPFKTVSQLVKAGVKVAIGHQGYWEVRNLMHNAGTTVAFGLTPEQALTCITLNAAEVCGISDRIGSLEKGKDASFVVSEGDILDMRTSSITHAYMDGKEVALDNQQKQLYRKFKQKYGLK